MNVHGERSIAATRLAAPMLVLALLIAVALSVGLWSPFPLLFTVLLALVAYPWYRSVSQGRLDLFEPIVLHSIFFGMVVVALFDRVYLSEPSFKFEIISLSHTRAFTVLCLLFATLFASTLLGYYWLGPSVPSLSDAAGRVGKWFSRAEGASGQSYRLVAVGYLLLGVLSLLGIVVFVFPTPDPLFVFRTNQPRSELFAGSNVLVMGTRGLYVGYLFWLAGALAERRTPSLLELFAAGPVVALVLLTGGRARAFQIVLMVAIVCYYVVVEDALEVTRGLLARIAGRAPPFVVFGVLPVVGLAGAVFLVSLRGLRQGQSIAQSIQDVDPVSVVTAGIHNDQFDHFLALTEIVPEEFGFYYGTFYARVPLNLIPRRFWSGKPVLTAGGMLRRALLPEQAGGRSTGALGDYFVNFGYPGVIPMGLLYGAVLHLLGRLVRGERLSPLRLTLFAVFLSLIVRAGLTNGTLYNVQIHALLLAPGVLGLAVLASRSG